MNSTTSGGATRLPNDAAIPSPAGVDASLGALETAVGDVQRLSDARLPSELDAAFAERRGLESRIDRLSGEIAERSRVELGSQSLAWRNGSPNAAAMSPLSG